jgi:hypothetical protein
VVGRRRKTPRSTLNTIAAFNVPSAGKPNGFLGEVVRQLEDRLTRYVPLLMKLFPTPESRPRQREVLIEIFRKGKTPEAFRVFRKIYLEVIDQMIDHLKSQDAP